MKKIDSGKYKFKQDTMVMVMHENQHDSQAEMVLFHKNDTITIRESDNKYYVKYYIDLYRNVYGNKSTDNSYLSRESNNEIFVEIIQKYNDPKFNTGPICVPFNEAVEAVEPVTDKTWYY